MNQRLLVGTLFFSLACSTSPATNVDSGTHTGGASGTGTGGATGKGGTTGAGGATGTGGVAGTGTGGVIGTGGVAGTGTGGVRGTGGAPAAGTGGIAGTGTGGAPATGTGGVAGTGTGGTTTTTGSNSVLERNLHPNRDGNFLQPTLTKAAAATMATDTGFPAAFTGNTWASPLYFENGPGGKGLYIVATTSNTVIALDETTGTQVWSKAIGTPSTSPNNGCGFNPINPLGILSTPVIDATSRTIYAAGAIGSASGITGHIASALSVDDGSVKTGWPVNISTVIGFDPTVHNQRSALSLLNGILYVAYGGFVGDCGGYHGRVVAINTANPATVAGWATGGQGEGIWAAGGLASDGTSVFAVTGNSNLGTKPATHDDQEEVARISGMATFTRSNQNVYFPSRFLPMDNGDFDLGASNAVYIGGLTGYTPANYVVTISKDGHMYFLDSANLGGSDGHKVDFMVSAAAMNIRTVPTVFKTAKGTHIAFSIGANPICPNGMTGAVVMSVLVPPATAQSTVPVPQIEWCAAISGSASPISTTTDGLTNAVVWYMSGSKLLGVDGDTGASVFGGGSTNCTNVRQWTSPIAVKGHILAAGDGHLCSFSPH
jgi:hypothetical protein